jgi:hypothetical protein
MAGLLQFSLGLTTGSFLSAASRAQGALGGVIRSGLGLPGIGAALGGTIAAFTSLHAVAEGVFNAIAKGAKLHDLSNRTGETVSDLFALQRAFQIVGVSSEAVPVMLLRMQKALGGVNEMGEPTKDVFAQIGLSTAALKKMGGPEALTAIASALAKLDKSTATNIANTIFGRGAAGDILQIARDSKDFADELQRAARVGDIFERMHVAFDQIDDGMVRVGQHAGNFFVGLASGLEPWIKKMVDFLNSFDLVSLGEKIGRVFSAASQISGTKNFAVFMGIALTAAFEKALNFLGQGMLAIAAATPGLMKAMAEGSKAVGTGLQKAMAAIGLDAMTDEVLRLDKAGQTNSEHYRATLQMARAAGQELDRLEGKSTEQMQKAFATAAEATAKGMEAAKKTPALFGTEAQQALEAAIEGLPKLIPPKSEPTEPGLDRDLERKKNEVSQARVKAEVDALTRIGFFATTGAGVDYPRQTASHTARMSTLLETHTGLLTRIAEGGTAPAAAHS